MVVLWQFCKMVYYWNTPGTYMGWNFLLYYAGYIALYWFVGVYKPKAWRNRSAGQGGRNG